MGCETLPPTLYKPLPRSFDHAGGGQSIDGVILASLCLFAHNNTRPRWGEGGRKGDNGGGGEEVPTSLAPLPSVLRGTREGGCFP